MPHRKFLERSAGLLLGQREGCGVFYILQKIHQSLLLYFLVPMNTVRIRTQKKSYQRVSDVVRHARLHNVQSVFSISCVTTYHVCDP